MPLNRSREQIKDLKKGKNPVNQRSKKKCFEEKQQIPNEVHINLKDVHRKNFAVLLDLPLLKTTCVIRTY